MLASEHPATASSPNKKRRGFMRVASPAVAGSTTLTNKKEVRKEKDNTQTALTGPAPSRRLMLPLFHTNQHIGAKRDHRRSSADAQSKQVADSGVGGTPTSEGMSLLQRLTQGRSCSTVKTPTTPPLPKTSSTSIGRHKSDVSDSRRSTAKITSFSSEVQSNPHNREAAATSTGHNLETVIEMEGTNLMNAKCSAPCAPMVASCSLDTTTDGLLHVHKDGGMLIEGQHSPSPIWFDSWDAEAQSTFNRSINTDTFLASDGSNLRSMEQSLLKLLEDFRSGKLKALSEEVMSQMRKVRMKQEQLTQLHLDIYLDQRKTADQSFIEFDHNRKHREKYEHLSQALQDLEESMQVLCERD